MLSACSDKENEVPGIAEQMQNFVINIAGYARNYDDSFIVIAQNGEELAFNNADTSGGLGNICTAYTDVVNAFSAEEVHYSGTLNLNYYRRNILLLLGSSIELSLNKTVMVSDYLLNNEDWFNAAYLSSEFGLLNYIRMAGNYNYSRIPDIGTGNIMDVNNIDGVSNYLCLLDTDNFADPGEMIDSISASNYDLVVIDLFFNDHMLTPEDLAKIRNKQNGSKRLIIGYVSIGTAENYRYYWQSSWTENLPEWIIKPHETHSDEYWVDFRNKDWENIIYGNDDSYIKKIVDAGFDGVLLDHLGVYKQIEQAD